MKFAITATDRFLGVFETFVLAGWKPLKLFTVPLVHPLSNQQAVIGFAQKQDAAIQLSRMTERDLAELNDMGCEALIVASYDWKILEWQKYLKYAVNFHSSPLPEGRGPYPVSRAIAENWPFWGVTCHKVTNDIDQGDILATDRFPLQNDECHESLDLKIQMSAKRLANRLAHNLPELWNQATPQQAGSYWPKTTIKERVIDFNQPIEKIMRHIRAFGSTESVAFLNNNWFIVKRAIGWTEQHTVQPGLIVHVFNRHIVVAAIDGYIGLLENDLVPPNVAQELQRLQTNS